MHRALNKVPIDALHGMQIYRLGVFDDTSFDLVELKGGEAYPPHYHRKSQATLYVIIGEGSIILNGKKYKYKRGNKFQIRRGMKHGFKARTDTLFLSTQVPPIRDEKTGIEDIHF